MASLRSVVGVEVVDENHARGDTSWGGVERRGLFGGQMVAQALFGLCPHPSRRGDPGLGPHRIFWAPVTVESRSTFRSRRSGTVARCRHRDVRGFQEGQPILHASVVSSGPSPGFDWQLTSMPVVGPPDTSPEAPRAWAQGLGRELFEVAHPIGKGKPRSFPLWVRSAIPIDDVWLQSASLAFWSDFGLNWSARETHTELDGVVSSVSATHGLWFHRRTRPDEWHLFDVHTHSISGNQVFVRASLFNATGRLVASVDQGVFIRRTPA